jgi:hypothetical protein
VIILDENFPESQRQLLKAWHIPIRQIGVEISRKGIQDDEIIPFLLGLRRPTFFTLDDDFYSRHRRHARYSLVCVDVAQYEAAAFVRRFLRHKDFDTEAKRMGLVVRLSHAGIFLWRLHVEEEARLDWE